MDGLGDSVFFVGDDDSFSLSAKEFPDVKGIVFISKKLIPLKFLIATRNRWLDFDLKDGTVGGSLLPGYSNIFRPRPTWVERRLGNLSNKVPESEKLPQSLDLRNYRVKEVAKSYRLEKVYQGKGINRKKPVVFEKAVVSSCYDESDNGFALMTIMGGLVLVWRNVDKKWATIIIDYEFPLDIIYHNEKFFALMICGVTVIVDSKSLTVSEVAGPPIEIAMYLVKSSQDLFMITKNWQRRNEPAEFKVYKLDEEKCEWVEVIDGLEDSVFFVGNDGSFSVSAKEFPGCKGDCVYFKEGPIRGGIIDLKDGTVGGFSAFPGYCNIFWPRPTWVE
ncbi:F-box protein SKIP23-like [Pistacia vera]|uniref:F-box protein SKIP23-like n=1 Tax=Pistacia vera TaxID=55513 RepID=UPI001262FA2F|nr:F-box protein SKIP23-like [Pistacia vera]